jgi:hypothetical protein
MARKRPARTGNPDLRQQKQVPMPPNKGNRAKLLSPLSFKTLRLSENEHLKKVFPKSVDCTDNRHVEKILED